LNLLPYDDVLGRDVFGLADANLAVDLCRVERGGDPDHDVVGAQLGREVGFDVDSEVDPGLADLVDDGLDPEREADIGGRPVAHQLKLAVGRDERDGPVRVKLAELDALVELAVVKLDRSSIGRPKRARLVPAGLRKAGSVRGGFTNRPN